MNVLVPRHNEQHAHTKIFKYIDFMYIYSCGWLEKKHYILTKK